MADSSPPIVPPSSLKERFDSANKEAQEISKGATVETDIEYIDIGPRLEPIPSDVEHVQGATAPPGGSSLVGDTPTQRERQRSVENILSEGLEQEYAAMDPELGKKFRQEGERTATAIRTLIERGQVVARKIVDLIRQWLSIIPAVNRFFLEQEAKIKTDRILELARTQHGDAGH